MKRIFVDKIGREIEISEDMSGILAKHQDKIVGRFTFEDAIIEKFGQELVDMQIDSNYRGAGIGKEMMREAVSIYGEFLLPQSYDNSTKFSEMRNPLTQDGANLIKKCLKEGILPEEFSNQDDYLENNIEDDY